MNSSSGCTVSYIGLDFGQNETFAWLGNPGGPAVVLSWVATPGNESDLIKIHFLFRLSPYANE